MSSLADKIFAQFRSEAANLRAKVKRVRADLEKARRRRDELRVLPLPPNDLADVLYEALCLRADKLHEQWGRWGVTVLLNNPNIKAADLAGNQGSLILGHTGVSRAEANRQELEAFFGFFFPEMMKEGLRRMCSKLSYTYGPGRAERQEELASLEARIAALESEESALAQQIDSLKRDLEADSAGD